MGNGRLGAMVFGKVDEELLQLNESTLWSGGPVNPNPNPTAPTYLPPIRKALDEENYELATTLTKKMQGLYTESYEPLADLLIRQPFSSKPTTYYRDLNIEDAVATTRFTVDGVSYTRDVFVSAPDQVIVVRQTASQAGKLNFVASLKSQLRYKLTAMGTRELALTGNATEVVLLLTAATSFNGFDKSPDKDGKNETQLVENYLNGAVHKPYASLKQTHMTDYQAYFNRVSLTLAGNLPTDERLRQYATGGQDLGQERLYYQYGRYLLISSGRHPASQPAGSGSVPATPANLQGIWNPHVRPPWSSNYTININTQMTR